MIEEGRAIFVQIAEAIENSILDGSLPEDGRAPSTNELAAFHRINPATAAKGLNLLADEGILVKRRGLGMFVAPGARRLLIERRQAQFDQSYVVPLVAEARKLELTIQQIHHLIDSHLD